MKWLAIVMGIATVSVGCGDLKPCPGSDVCGVGDSVITKNACGCECQPSQKEDAQHMCCDAALGCMQEQAMPDPQSGMTPTANFPRLRVEALNAVPAGGTAAGDIGACQAFSVVFAYVNQANGSLLTPLGYGVATPMLAITEVGVGTAIVSGARPVAWTEGLAPGGIDPKSEDYGNGVNPNNTSLMTTVTIEVAMLPTGTAGITALGKDIGRFGSDCS